MKMVVLFARFVMELLVRILFDCIPLFVLVFLITEKYLWYDLTRKHISSKLKNRSTRLMWQMLR